MSSPRSYICHRASNPPILTGRLDSLEWEAASWTDNFVDIQSGNAVPLRTRMKMLWDDRCLYIGAEMEEQHVWATLTEHDSIIFQDNDFELFIDPDGDNHDYYEVEINALGTVWDLRLAKPYRDGGTALSEWEIPGLKTCVHIDGTLNDPSDTDKGWGVELAIPWLALGEFAKCPSPPRDGDQWRMNFSRVQWQTEIVNGRYQKIAGLPEDNWVWSPQGAIDMHRPEKWGYVQFSTEPLGAAVFVPDEAAAAKDELHQVYYRQKDFQRGHGRFASSLAELGHSGKAALTLRLTDSGFIASALAPARGGTSRTWMIREDSLIWSE